MAADSLPLLMPPIHSAMTKQNFGKLPHRRGVLLLIVLSMLSLFMMLGVAYVVMASRARDTARAFSALSADTTSEYPSAAMLDRALSLLVGGAKAGAPLPKELTGGFPLTFECLLEDLYGNLSAAEGKVKSIQGNGPIVSMVLTLNAPPPAPKTAELNGRVLTLLPSIGKPTSHRILRAEDTAAGLKLWIANSSDTFEKVNGIYQFPPDDTKVVINDRARDGSAATKDEPWDGFAFSDDPYLARVEPVPSTPSSADVRRASMVDKKGSEIQAAGDVDGDKLPDFCDNDNDGIIDGQFFDPQFPILKASNGNDIVTHMSCLIVDLDGRLNVNAHGSLASTIYPASHPDWPGGGAGPFKSMPLSSGYGPADIAPAIAFKSLAKARGFSPSDDDDSQGTPDNPAQAILTGATAAKQIGFTGRAQQSPGCRTFPMLSADLEGRYAGKSRLADLPLNSKLTAAVFDALPGINKVNDKLSTFNEVELGDAPDVLLRIDLHGRMKSRASSPAAGSIVPKLSFAKPDASPEFTDDPYEVVFANSSGGGVLADPTTGGLKPSSIPDNLFSIAELERVLRPYDADSYQLPSRLFTALGSQAEGCRLVVTTDSWDVPSVTGNAADRFYKSGWFFTPGIANLLHSTTGPSAASPNALPDGLMPTDIAAGLKLNVTRPLVTPLQRRALFKDAFMTVVALLTAKGSDPTLADAERYAQWAANLVEYQDADSAMTEYEYDTVLIDGWNVDGNPETQAESTRATVWGAERPEIVITQTLAWKNSDTAKEELFVVLHRPWNSELNIPGSPVTTAEPVDENLRKAPNAPQSELDLRKQSGGSPVWRIRLGTTAASPVVRFDTGPHNGTDIGSAAPPAFLSTVGPDEWVCVCPPLPSGDGITVDAALQPFPLAGLKAPAGTTFIRLERLADPSKPFDAASNPYLIVDAAPITIVDRAIPPANPPKHKLHIRNGWGQDNFPASALESGVEILKPQWDGSPRWLMWPNRPLVAITELMHVPGSAPKSFRPQNAASATDPDMGMLKNYAPPTGFNYLPSIDVLDAVRVPSRFAGTRLTIENTANNAAAIANLHSVGVYEDIIAVNQLDLARNPGMVNLNTISCDAVWDAVVKGPLAPIGPNAVISRATPNPPNGSPNGADFVTAPAKSFLNILALDKAGSPSGPFVDKLADISDVDDNPLHKSFTATRLGNTATNRSHTFAIWITLRSAERIASGPPAQMDPDSVRYHRMFLIFDRSRPIPFDPGKQYDAQNGVALKRVLQ